MSTTLRNESRTSLGGRRPSHLGNVNGGTAWSQSHSRIEPGTSGSWEEDETSPDTAHRAGSSGAHDTTVNAAKPVKRRRISASQRQRAEVSCDRCKSRKTRCIRSSAQETCAACAQLDLVCESTAQRKQKASTNRSEEEILRLESRCRALEALVAQDHPGVDVHNTDALVGLHRGYSISTVDVAGRANGRDAQTIPVMMSSVDQDAQGDLQHSDPFDSVMALKIPEGSLIPAPNNTYHYVGPASSYLFANTIRRLVTRSSALPSLLHRNKLRRQQRAADFASHDRTTALEARVSGHPVTTATSDLDAQGSPAAPSPVSFLSPSYSRSVVSPASRQQLRDALPERQLADRLVNTFFAKVHTNMSIFHRGSFQIRYESLWDHAGSSARMGPGPVPDPGWICALFMVFVLGAQATDRFQLPTSTDLQSKYLSLIIRHGLQRLVLTATLTNVQSLLLLSLYQHNAGERNTSWTLLGNATRMAMSLGLQRDGENGNFDAIERNVRRMLWWQLQLFEQNMSFELGRPCSTEGIEVTASLPDEAFTDGGDSPPHFLANALTLGRLSLRVKRFVAAYSGEYEKPSTLEQVVPLAEHLDRQLTSWRSALPPHLQQDAHFATSKHRRLVVMLHTNFHHIRSILGRPYLLCCVNTSLEEAQVLQLTGRSGTRATDVSPSSAIHFMAQVALQSATESLSALLSVAHHGLIEGEIWHDFYYGHHASMMLSLPFLVEASHLSSDSYRGLVSTFHNLSQRTSLAPTYRILVNVSMQFAKIVGIGPEDDPSRPASPHLPPVELQAAERSLSQQQQQSQDQRIDQWMEPAFYPQDQALTLEQLLGVGNPVSPMVPTAQSRTHDMDFSDLYNYGFADWPGNRANDNGNVTAAPLVGFSELDGPRRSQFANTAVPSTRSGNRGWEQDFFGLGNMPDTGIDPLDSLDFQGGWMAQQGLSQTQGEEFNGLSNNNFSSSADDAQHGA